MKNGTGLVDGYYKCNTATIGSRVTSVRMGASGNTVSDASLHVPTSGTVYKIVLN